MGIWILLILLKTENNKNINFRLLFTLTKHCSFTLIHCLWDMNSARGASKNKKKKCKTQNVDTESKHILRIENCLEPKRHHFLNNNNNNNRNKSL